MRSAGTDGLTPPKLPKTWPTANTWVSWLAAGLFLIGYFCVAGLLLANFGLAENPVGNWERSLTIFNAFSAIGFAAAGVLLGTTVQQSNVANAKKETVEAKKNEHEMAKGSKNLSELATRLLHDTPAGNSDALWSGTLRDGSTEVQLRDAIMDMNELLREYSLRQAT